MAEANIVLCEPCEHHGTKKNADIWCKNCSEGFCNTCVKAHKVTKILRNHKLISVSDHMKTYNSHLADNCTDHNKKLVFFCKQHDAVICHGCVNSKHSKCADIISIEKAAVNVKTSTAITELDKNIFALLNHVKDQREQQQNEVKNLHGKEHSIIQQIKHIRQKLEKRLDVIQEQLIKDVNTKCQESIAEVNKCETDLLEIEFRILKIKEQKSEFKEFSSNSQIFIGMKNLERKLHEEKIAISRQQQCLKKHHVELQMNSKLNLVFENTKILGEIIHSSESILASIEDKKIQQAQRELHPIKAIEKFKLERIKKIEIPVPKKGYVYLSGCLILPNKEMVFADKENQRLVIHDESGKFSREIKFSYPPHYITVTEGNNVAVSYGEHHKVIDLVNTATGKVEKTITGAIEHYSMGISYNNGKLYAVDGRKVIKEITLGGIVTNTISLNKNVTVNRESDELEDEEEGTEWMNPHVHNITTFKDKIYYAATFHDTLYCCDMKNKGKELWQYSSGEIVGEYSSPALTVDSHGNVFVGNFECLNKLYVVSADGQHVKNLFDDGESDFMPNGIWFDKASQILLVCDYREHAILFKVKEQK